MKRRDFLKGMASTGAAASLAGGLGIVPALMTPRTAHAAGRNKLVFISDLHMNVIGPFSWLDKHAVDLAGFLENVNSRDDVSELIILGDLLDDWVMPVKQTPQTFGDILGANYDNTGTWIDKKPMTWVEIEINDGESGRKDYTVALWFYGESSPRQSGTVTVQFENEEYMIPHR